MDFSRRKFLELLAGTAALGATPLPLLARESWTPHPEDLLPGPAFRHGVASGDPLKTRVILWTRVTPDSKRQAIPVRCVVATDRYLRHVVGRYHALATPYADYTVKLDAAGLRPGKTYYYQFYANGEASAVGRTRTLPREAERVRLGLASCSNLPAGFFGAYALLAQQASLDAIVHVGDYIYEYGNGTFGDGTDIGRIPEPNAETVALGDYRTRYAQYRRDYQLQEAHRLHPWIVVWDDHEFANNAYRDGAENHQPDEGDWELRKAAAQRAWFEWLPVRDPHHLRARSGRIFRRFRFGELVQLDMLDTRVFGREQQVPALVDGITQQLLVDPEALFGYLKEISRTDRQLLGIEQERWLYRQLEEHEERDTGWQVLGQQVMMGQLSVAAAGLPPGTRIPINTDQWDGYTGARTRLLDFLQGQGLDNLVILTGDFHSSWANDIAASPYDARLYDPLTGTGSQAVEFVGPAISSPFFVNPDPAFVKGVEQFALATNPHTHYIDMEHNGYLVVDFDEYRARAEFYHIDDVLNPDSAQTLAAAVEVASGSRHAQLVEGAVS